MTIQEILHNTKHRPWQIPTGNWKYYQEWNKAIFLHWQVELDELRKLVPKELEIDLYAGKPWVSAVAFTMEKMRPKNLPTFLPISNFHEVNIRTYVRSNNKAGVYFLSIEGGTYLSCKLAKGISKLPYRYSKIKRAENQYHTSNSGFGDKLELEYAIGKKLKEKTELDKWLTERYALFQDSNRFIYEFEIHHLEWPINKIELKKLDCDYPRFQSLIKNNPDQIHYSEGVKVIAWGRNKKEITGYNSKIG